MNNSVLATITTYNPEIDLLERNIDAVLNQVDKLIVYENDSSNREAILNLCEKKSIEVVCNDKNYGVAKPLYDGIVYADKNNFRYILTLDQDSVMSSGAVEKLVDLIQGDSDLAIVATKPIVESESKVDESICENRYVDSVITSGSLADVAKIKNIGNYIPEMFIDWVDNEICYRAIENGYKIMQSDVPMFHKLGECQRRRFFWRFVHIAHYSGFRYYYIFRNGYFCNKRFKKNRGVTKRDKRYLYSCIVKVILYEKNKKEKLKAMKKGLRDGKKFYAEMQNKYAHTKIMGDNAR